MAPQRSLRTPWVCFDCLSTRLAPRLWTGAISSAPGARNARRYSSVTAPPQSPPSTGHAQLTHRRLISLHGPEVPQFLQGLITNTVRAPPSPSNAPGIYSAFLNAQGRVLHDVFIYPASHSSDYRNWVPDASRAKYGDEGWFIECDAEYIQSLYKHLKRYKLRSKFDLRVVDEGEWKVWNAWDGDVPWTQHSSQPSSSDSASSAGSQTIGTSDARAPGMGRRLILPSTQTPASTGEAGDALPVEAYHVRRWTRGVAENQIEIAYTTALPQESNIDFMAAGVDFRKGCYLGQELTIRTHHTGVVRKRIVPCLLYPDSSGTPVPKKLAYDPGHGDLAARLTAGANISPAPRPAGGSADEGGDEESGEGSPKRRRRKGRSVGKWLGTGVGNVGLALCRLEMVSDIVLTAGEGSRFREDDEFVVSLASSSAAGEAGEDGGETIKIKPFVPDWIRGQIKVKTPNARV